MGRNCAEVKILAGSSLNCNTSERMGCHCGFCAIVGDGVAELLSETQLSILFRCQFSFRNTDPSTRDYPGRIARLEMRLHAESKTHDAAPELKLEWVEPLVVSFWNLILGSSTS